MPTLYVAATPIGNLSDVSPRLLETLQSVSLIAAEDTRVTGNLLRFFEIKKPMTSLHRHNEKTKTEYIVSRMQSEQIDVALVTDAGTPAISDPGHLLVALAHRNKIQVMAVAGPSAVAAALSVSGFDASEFAFYGFSPRENKDLVTKLRLTANGPKVAVFYESPHRVIGFIETVADVFPKCEVCLCRELTKLHEQTIRGNIGEALNMLRANPMVEKGEYCVVLNLSSCDIPEPVADKVSVEARILELLLQDVPMSEALETLRQSGIRRNEVKRAAIHARLWLDRMAADKNDNSDD